MSYEQLNFDVQDDIATLTLNRPDALNALSDVMARNLGDALKEIGGRAGDDIKVVILTGAGRAFCAGGDVKRMNNDNRSPQQTRDRLRSSHNRMYDLLNIELPVISLVNGPAAGAGANIALAADFVFATPKAFFMQAFGRIGLVPDWSGFYILPRLVGLQRAKELVFTARRVYAQEAKDMGMVYQVVEADSAMEQVREFASRFTHASTTAIGVAKNVLNQSLSLDHRSLLELEASAQAVCSVSPYHREAVARFADKQPAMFDWEALAEAKGSIA